MDDDECPCKICGAKKGEEHRSWPWDHLPETINLPFHLSDLSWTAWMDQRWAGPELK